MRYYKIKVYMPDKTVCYATDKGFVKNLEDAQTYRVYEISSSGGPGDDVEKVLKMFDELDKKGYTYEGIEFDEDGNRIVGGQW